MTTCVSGCSSNVSLWVLGVVKQFLPGSGSGFAWDFGMALSVSSREWVSVGLWVWGVGMSGLWEALCGSLSVLVGLLMNGYQWVLA